MADQPRGRGRGGAPRGDRGRGRGGQGGAFPTGGRGGSFPPARGGGRGGGDRGGSRGGRGDFRGGGRSGGGDFRGGPRGGSDRGGSRGGRGGGRGRDDGPAVYTGRNNQIPEPDGAVQALEDARQRTRQTEPVLGSLSLANTMPARPGYGTKGTQIKVWANYVEMVPRLDLVLYSYDVAEITPNLTGKKRSQLIRLMMTEASELADYRDDIVSDFKATIISRKKLELGNEKINVTYRAEGEDEPKPRATTHTIVCKFTKTLSTQSLMEYLTSTDLSVVGQYDSKLEMVQALNIFLKHYVKSANNLATIGASKSFSVGVNADAADLGSGLKAIRGFFTSVRAATNRILVNINVSHGAFYQEGQLSRLMDAYGRRNLRSLEKFLKRVRVRTTHLPPKKNKQGQEIPRVKTIYGLAAVEKRRWAHLAHPPRVSAFGAGPKNVEFWWSEDAPMTKKTASVPGAEPAQSTPKKKGKGKGGKGKAAVSESDPAVAGPAPVGQSDAGQYISVYDFFLKKHQIPTDPSYPVVNVGNAENPSYLPVEICVVMDGQACSTKLKPDQTSNMIRFAVRKPGANALSIVRDGFGTAGLTSSNPILAKYGVSIGQDLITVPARVLPEPKVLYRNNTLTVEAGSWNMRNVKFNKSGSLTRWSWLVIHAGQPSRGYDFNSIGQTVRDFHVAMGKTGVTAPAPTPGKEVMMGYPTDSKLEEKFREFASVGVELILIVLPTDTSELYNYIKTLGEIKYGIRTQCVIGSKFVNPRGQPMYFANVAHKINLKVGGHNHMVEQDRLSFIQEDKTMLVGIDVTHPSPGSSDHAPSVAAMVASIDKNLGQWPGILRIQDKARKEMVSDIKDMLKSRLTMWKTMGRHASFPENILVYRDGVSEGQYQLVLDQELTELRAACKEMYPPADTKRGLPHITIVVVGKRHHTRCFPCSVEDGDRNGNCRQGTVVDRGITEEGCWDCYLQSHSVIQGTGRPAHYFVIIDEIFRARARNLRQSGVHATDEFEKITQALCYVFGRATKAVSICTPAYYADILCERARRYLADVFDGTSDTASVADDSSTTGRSVADTNIRTKIIARLENTMFYI